MIEPIKVFVGTDVNGGCSECQMVFEYSLKKHASMPVEIIWMKISNDPNSYWNGWNTSKWSTPFSGFRWGIPEYCNFKGKAIYNDDDQVWLDDIANLYNLEFESGKIIMAKPYPGRFCVAVWNNEEAKNYLPPISKVKLDKNFHAGITQEIANSNLVQYFDTNWNNFDGEDEDIKNIKLLHLTNMASNPGVKLAIKRLGNQAHHWYNGPIIPHRRPDIEQIFYQYYEEALSAGYKVEDYISGERMNYVKQDQSQYKANNGWD